MTLDIAIDCRHYQGDRPCRFRRRCHCPYYDRMEYRVLIIKTAALGDVVRTACLLPTLRRYYPRAHVTWVTKPNGAAILAGHPQIDRLVRFDAEGILTLTQERFDLVLSLDKEPAPAALCNAVNSPDKRGIRLSPWGTPVPCSAAAEPYFELGLDDDLKFRTNRQSYPELIHRALGLDYVREPYRLHCPEAALARAAAMFAPWRQRIPGPVIGLNTGAGTVFANKAPKPARWVQAAKLLRERRFVPVLLGGPEETQTNEWILEQVGPGLHTAGCDNTESEFVAVVSQCDAVVTGDTLGLHIALARQIPVVALFGPTCEQEIDLFGFGCKLISSHRCGPCYRRHCDQKPNCMDAISPEQIVEAVESVCAIPAQALERI